MTFSFILSPVRKLLNHRSVHTKEKMSTYTLAGDTAEYTQAELRQRAALGRLLPDHVISGEGLPGPTRAGSVSWLAPIFATPAASSPGAIIKEGVASSTQRPFSAFLCTWLAWLSLLGGLIGAGFSLMSSDVAMPMRITLAGAWLGSGVVSLGVFLALSDIVAALDEIRKNTRR